MNEAKANLIEALSAMREDSTFADFKFVVKGKEFMIHKNILAARSPVFARLFSSGMQEARDNICIVDSIDPETFEVLMQFIYEAKMPAKLSKKAQDIYEASDYYDLRGLRDFCAKEIYSQLSKDNALELFCWSHAYDNLKELQQDSFEFVKRDVIPRMENEPLSPKVLKIVIEEQRRQQQNNYQIFIKTLYDKTIPLLVKPSDTIARIKLRIYIQEAIRAVDQRFIFKGKKLDDDRTLSDYNVQNDSILYFVERLGGYQIFVKTSTGKTYRLNSSGCDTIARIKARIHVLEGIRPENQRLMTADGQQMEDGRTISYYSIEIHSTLQLIYFP